MDLVGPLNANFDMYVSYGLEPNNFKYDAKSTKGASKESITIDNAKKGNYYVMIFSKQGNGNFTLTASSGPAPSAVVITSKENLKTKYGQEGFDKIEQRIKDYMKAVIDGGIKANLIYVDDANCLSPFNLRPVDPNNAGKIKDLIDSLDKSLSHSVFHYYRWPHCDSIPYSAQPRPGPRQIDIYRQSLCLSRRGYPLAGQGSGQATR